MVEKIPVRPESVRGLGNIISPAKTLADFSVFNSSLSFVDGFYTMEYSTTSVRVELTASASSIRVGESLVLTATVTDGGTAVEDASVSFTSGNLVIGTDTTDENGVASVTTSSLEVGSYSITATYDEVVSSAVSVTVNTAFTSVTVSSDKSILSYADSESATLTAQLMNGASTASVSGETVQFYRWVDGYADQSTGEWVVNNDVLIDTQDTNSSGVATGTYTSAGIGDIQVYAKVRSLVSKIYELQDCDYNADTSKISEWNNVSSGGTAFKKSTYAISLSNYSVEMKFNTINAQIMVGNEQNWVAGLSFVSSPFYFYTHSSSGGTVTDVISSPTASDVWRMEIEGTTIRLYRNETLIITKNNCKVDYPTNLRLYPQNKSSSVDYVKVKPL